MSEAGLFAKQCDEQDVPVMMLWAKISSGPANAAGRPDAWVPPLTSKPVAV
jgi:hypothetical protein